MSGSRTTLPVAVIIPAWRSAHTLGGTVESVLAGTARPAELVVVDDGSPDDVPGALAPFGDRVRYLRQDNAGPGAARNRGVHATTAPLLAFLDADDQWLPGRLERTVAALDDDLQADFCFSDAWDWDGRERVGSRHARRRPPVEGASLATLAAHNYVPLLTALVRRSAFLRVGGFDERREFMAVEDYDLWLRILLEGRGVYLPEKLALYRRAPGSLGSNANLLAGIRRVHAKLLARPDCPAGLATVFKRRECETRLDLAWDHLAAGEYGQAVRQAAAVVRRRPRSGRAWKFLMRGLLRR